VKSVARKRIELVKICGICGKKPIKLQRINQ
jgi:hypothetical protein